MPKFNNLLLFGGIAGAAVLGFLFFTEPGKNILRQIEQQYYITKILPMESPQDRAQAEARYQKTGYY